MNKPKRSPAFLSKSTFIRGLQCEKSYYLHKKRPFLRDKLPPEQLAKFIRGTNVGVYARELFPGGINASPGSGLQMTASIKRTGELLKEACPVIYEASFQYDGVRAALDILVAEDDGWRAVEVKSSRSLSDTYIWDAALQYHILNGAGLKINRFELVYINPAYVMHGALDVHALFVFKDVTEEVKDRQADVIALIEKLRLVDAYTSSPDIPIGPHCHDPYPCDFIGHCWKKTNRQHENTAFGDELTNEALVSRTVSSVTKPASVYAALVFSPAIPLFEGTRPYNSLVFLSALYSLDDKNPEPVFYWPLQWPEGVGSGKKFTDRLGSREHLVHFGDEKSLPTIGFSLQSNWQPGYTDLSQLFKKDAVVSPGGVALKSPEAILMQMDVTPEPFPGRIKSDPEAATLYEKIYRQPTHEGMEYLIRELTLYLTTRLRNLGRLWEIVQDKNPV